MTTRRMITVVAALALVAVPGVMLAQAFGGPGGGPGPGPGMHLGGGPGLHMVQRLLTRLGDYLQLTDEQRTQIEGIAQAARTEIQPLAEQAIASRQAFHEASQPGAFNEEQFRAFAQQQADIQVNIKVAAARAMAQAVNVLTPEQKQKLEELRPLFGPGRHGQGFRHGGPRQGS